MGALRAWLDAIPPRGDAPGMLEEFLVGEEHTFDSITVGGRTVFSSVSDYLPPPRTWSGTARPTASRS